LRPLLLLLLAALSVLYRSCQQQSLEEAMRRLAFHLVATAAAAATVVAPAVAAQQPRSVPLLNAAETGMTMPLAGMGMPCGPTYKCPQSSYEATLTFLALGGRHTDSADSYTGAEPGIGLAMREWMAADPANHKRSELFIGSKIGPGGACWPLGYNESIAQAKMIITYYNSLPSPMPTVNITRLDLLLIHWPVNYGPCSIPGPNTIPTTDPLCDSKLPSYDEKGCRISTWRGMVDAMKMGLARAIGVSNFNSTNMEDLKDAGLPLPAANQIEWNPGIVPKPFVPYPHAETFASLQKWCVKNNVSINSYSPFGGHGNAGKTFSNPLIQAVAAAHNVSAAQAVLRWNVQQNIPVIPMATNPSYQAENLDIFGFTLTEQEMMCMATLSASFCPPPPPPPPPTPAQLKCEFMLKGVGNITLKTLPAGPFTLKDTLGDSYAVTTPCGSISSQHTAAPAVEDVTIKRTLYQIPLGFLTSLTTVCCKLIYPNFRTPAFLYC
jgi:diketogulonate reductase-like aldo/keto reductase